MASANHDANHLRLSRKIGDAVAAAGTDGTVVTSAQRNDYLNRANRFIQLFFKNDKKAAQDWLEGLVTKQSLTFSGSGVSVASDYSYWLGCYMTGAGTIGELTYIEPQETGKSIVAVYPEVQGVFSVFGGKVYAYKDNIALSVAGALYYIASDYRASAADASDIAIDSIWFDTLVDIAALFFYYDKGDIDFAQATERQRNLILGVIGGKSVS